MLYILKFFYVFISPAVVLVPLLTGLTRLSTLNLAARIMLYFIILSALSNLIVVITYWLQAHNQWMLHAYTILEFILLGLFYYTQFKSSKTLSKIVLLIICLFTVLSLLNTVYLQSFDIDDSYATSVEALLIMSMAVLYMNIHEMPSGVKHWKDVPENWFNAGILYYFCVAFFLFVFGNELIGAPKLTIRIVYTIHGIFLAVMYLLIAKGFTKCKLRAIT